MSHEFELVEQNLRQSFRTFASRQRSGEVREIAGVTIASAGVAFQMFNAAFLSTVVSAAPADLERRIATAQVHFQQRNLGWSYWVCEDLLDQKLRRRAARIFEKHHMHLSAEMPGMIAETLLPPRRPLPSLEVRHVEDQPSRRAFCDIGALCFHVPPEWFREIFAAEDVWNSDFDGYVGYVDGEPVATAATVIAGGAVGVYNVATLPSLRRRGYGEAVMRYAVAQARRQSGLDRTVLQSSEHGFRLYLAMGYRTVTRVAVYVSEER